MGETINRRCMCKGSPEGVWVVHCGASPVKPGNCIATSDCKGTCNPAGKFKPNKNTDLEYDMEGKEFIPMDPRVSTPLGPGEIKPFSTVDGIVTETIELKESELVNLIKRVINEIKEKPNFDSIIKQGRKKGKLRGISDDEATMELNRAWSILQDNPITPDTGKKFVCKGCGGGRGLCVLGGCFSGKKLTWTF